MKYLHVATFVIGLVFSVIGLLRQFFWIADSPLVYGGVYLMGIVVLADIANAIRGK